MSFDEVSVRRDGEGRFSEKSGSAPEVALSSPTPHIPRGHTLFENRGQSWRKYGGWSQDDIDRIDRFVERHQMRVTGKSSGHATEEGVLYEKVRYHMADGRVIEAGTSEGHLAAQQAVAGLVYGARQYRDFPQSRRYYADRERRARETFGAEYDSMVNPTKPSFLRRLFGR